MLFVAVAPPASHPRMASLLGDVADLKFFPHSAVSQPFSLGLQAESADRAYVELPDAVDKVDSSFIPELLRCLKKGGSLCVRHRAQGGGGEASWGDMLVYGGFVDCVKREGDGVMLETEAKKPNWDANASVPISLKKKQSVQPAAPKVWSVSADDGDELMDEDALLGEDDLKAKPKEVSECVASNGKKACKNCSCGLAEKLAEGEDASTAAPTSACGSCYLGDAFRCSTCPYRGTAPFKPGERVVISTD